MNARVFGLVCGLLAAAPPAASAAGYLDLHYTPQATFGDSDVAAKGDGFGARLVYGAGTALLTAEYGSARYDGFDSDSQQWRAGFGFALGQGTSLHAEYVDLDLDLFSSDDDLADGYAAHLQFGAPEAGRPGGYVRAGYLWLDVDGNLVSDESLEGPEYAVGAVVPMGGRLQGLLEYRSTRLETNDGTDFIFEEIRVGLRFPFGDPPR